MRSSTERIREDLGPEEDWAPITFAVNAANQVKIFASEGYADEKEKDAYVGACALGIIAHEAVVAGMVATTWMVKQEGKDVGDAFDAPPSKHPRRVETLMVVTLSAQESVFAVAEIKRRPQGPPALLPWEIMQAGEDAPQVTGAMFDPILMALKIVKHSKEKS